MASKITLYATLAICMGFMGGSFFGSYLGAVIAMIGGMMLVCLGNVIIDRNTTYKYIVIVTKKKGAECAHILQQLGETHYWKVLENDTNMTLRDINEVTDEMAEAFARKLKNHEDIVNVEVLHKVSEGTGGLYL